MDCNNSHTRKPHKSRKSSTKQRHHKSTRKSKTKQNQRSPARSRKSRNTKVRSKSSSRRRKGTSSDRSLESLSRLSSQKGTPYSSQESLQHFSEPIDSAFDSKPSNSKFSECSGASSDMKYLEIDVSKFKRNYFPIHIVDSSPEPDVILPKPTRSKPKLVVYDSDEDFPINMVHPGTYNYRSTLEPREQTLTKTKHVCPVRNKRSEEDKVIEELINTRYSKYKAKVNKLNYDKRKNYPVDIPLLDEITNNVQESCMIKSFDNFLKQPANEAYPTYVDIEQAFPKIR